MKEYAFDQNKQTCETFIELFISGNSEQLKLQMNLDQVERKLSTAFQMKTLELKAFISQVESSSEQFMRRCDERLEDIEKKMANMEEGPVLRAFTMSQVNEAKYDLENKIGELRLNIEDKLEDIEIDHLHVPKLIGPNEDCKFKNLFSFVKEGLTDIRDFHEQVNSKLVRLKTEYEDFSKKTGHAVRSKIPT